MNVSLSKTFEQYINKLIETGTYNNASEVVREALRLKMQQDETYQAKLEALRNDIGVACQQVERGEVSEWNIENFISRLDERKK